MADTFDIDTADVERLSASLARASSAMVKAGAVVVEKGAFNIKDDTRKNLSKHPSWKRLRGTVTYDHHGLTAEVGYEDRGQGNLAGIYEFGSARRGPHPTLYPAAGREAPRFAESLAEVAARVLRP